MKESLIQKVTVSLPKDVLHFADSYKETHNMNRSEVLALALRVLRKQELTEGYKALAAEQKASHDEFVDSGLAEVLDATEW
jgi:metal-responsive CopG/Arc/MetJ family transcriptional regulator